MGKNIKFIIFIIIITVITAQAPKAIAQEQMRTMTIVPPTVQQTLNPGDKAEGRMKVINDSREPIVFSVSIRDYIVVDTKGTPNFLPPNTLNKKYSASSWIAVFPTTFTLNPREKQELTYYIQVPADARPGGHYAGSVYAAASPYNPDGAGATIQTQLGTLFYITVNGPITEKAKVTSFLANFFQEYGPVKINTQIKNLGDLHIKPQGVIKVTDSFGKAVEQQKLNEFNIFPAVGRDYQNTFGQKWMIGKYTAALFASYGRSNNLPLMAVVTFWVFPWRIAAVTVLIIIAIILAIKLWKKKKGRKTHPKEPPVATESTTEKA